MKAQGTGTKRWQAVIPVIIIAWSSAGIGFDRSGSSPTVGSTKHFPRSTIQRHRSS